MPRPGDVGENETQQSKAIKHDLGGEGRVLNGVDKVKKGSTQSRGGGGGRRAKSNGVRLNVNTQFSRERNGPDWEPLPVSIVHTLPVVDRKLPVA